MTVLGIDIGGTNFRAGIVEEGRKIIKFEKVPVTSVFHSDDALVDLVRHLKAFLSGFSCDAAAVGFPATLNAERTRVVQAPNIPFMENLPVAEVLNRELGLPVLVERDVTFALCYDVQKYNLPAAGMICGIYFGTGIGNAMLIDGIPLRGRHGTAGELGHIPVAGSRIPCGCGNIGCMEAVAGGKALARIQKNLFPDTPVGEIFTRHGQEEALIEVIDGMASAVATEINILDPDFILLGGGVLNMKDFPADLLNERILEHTRKPLPYEDLHLIYTEDEPDKSVVGGAIYAAAMLSHL